MKNAAIWIGRVTVRDGFLGGAVRCGAGLALCAAMSDREKDVYRVLATNTKIW